MPVVWWRHTYVPCNLIDIISNIVLYVRFYFIENTLGALEFIIFNHRYRDNIMDTAVTCAEAGVNLELHPESYTRGVFDWLKYAVEETLVTQVLWERLLFIFFFYKLNWICILRFSVKNITDLYCSWLRGSNLIFRGYLTKQSVQPCSPLNLWHDNDFSYLFAESNWSTITQS